MNEEDRLRAIVEHLHERIYQLQDDIRLMKLEAESGMYRCYQQHADPNQLKLEEIRIE